MAIGAIFKAVGSAFGKKAVGTVSKRAVVGSIAKNIAKGTLKGASNLALSGADRLTGGIASTAIRPVTGAVNMVSSAIKSSTQSRAVQGSGSQGSVGVANSPDKALEQINNQLRILNRNVSSSTSRVLTSVRNISTDIGNQNESMMATNRQLLFKTEMRIKNYIDAQLEVLASKLNISGAGGMATNKPKGPGLLSMLSSAMFGDALLKVVGKALKKPFTMLKDLGVSVASKIKGVTTRAIARLSGIASNIMTSISNAGTKLFNGLKDFGGKVFGKIKGLGSTVLEKVKGLGTSIFNGIKNLGVGMFDKLKSFGKGMLSSITKTGAGVLSKLGVKDTAKTVLSKTKSVAGGVWDWVKGKASSAKNTVVKGASFVKDKAIKGAKMVKQSAIAVKDKAVKIAKKLNPMRLVSKTLKGKTGPLLKGIFKGAKKIPIIGPAINAVLAGFDIKSALADHSLSPKEKKKKVGGIIGGSLGGILGGAGLAALTQALNILPGLGVALGPISYIGGSLLGEYVTKALLSMSGFDEKVGDLAGSVFGLDYGDTKSVDTKKATPTDIPSIDKTMDKGSETKDVPIKKGAMLMTVIKPKTKTVSSDPMKMTSSSMLSVPTDKPLKMSTIGTQDSGFGDMSLELDNKMAEIHASNQQMREELSATIVESTKILAETNVATQTQSTELLSTMISASSQPQVEVSDINTSTSVESVNNI